MWLPRVVLVESSGHWEQLRASFPKELSECHPGISKALAFVAQGASFY